MQTAFGGLTKYGDNVDDDVDQLFLTDCDFRAVAGQRAAKFIAFSDNSTQMAIIVLYGIVLEPLRFLTKWLMLSSRQVSDSRMPPKLCTLTNPRCSPIRVIRQYYAGLLRGRSRRLILAWKKAGYSSLEEWNTREPKQAMLLKQLVLAADTWVYSRHADVRRFPYKLANVVDKRLSWSDRLNVANHFQMVQACCLDEFGSRRLRQKLHEIGVCDGESMFNPQAQNLIKAWVAGVSPLLTCAGVENRHARNRRSNSGQGGSMNAATFASRYVNAEANTLLKVRERTSNLLKMPPRKRKWTTAEILPPARRTIRSVATSQVRPDDFAQRVLEFKQYTPPRELHRMWVMKQLKRQGVRANLIESRRQADMQWDCLPEARKNELTHYSQLTRIVAEHNRKAAKAKKMQTAGELGGISDIAERTTSSTALVELPSQDESWQWGRDKSAESVLESHEFIHLGHAEDADLERLHEQTPPDVERRPLSHVQYESFVKRQPGGVKAAAEAFVRTSRAVGMSTAIPKKVRYAQSCGSLCARTCSKLRNMQTSMKDALHKLRLRISPKAEMLPSKGLVLAFELSFPPPMSTSGTRLFKELTKS